jgi:dolichyldiphosphatase
MHLQSRARPLIKLVKNPNDPLSYLSAWLALVPQALCVIYVTLIWASREIEIMMMFAGQMSCEALNLMLKRWIKEERPKRTTADMQASPHWMPWLTQEQRCTAKVMACPRHIPNSSPSSPSSLACSCLFDTCLDRHHRIRRPPFLNAYCYH